MTFHHNLWAGGFGHTTTRALTLSPELERETYVSKALFLLNITSEKRNPVRDFHLS